MSKTIIQKSSLNFLKTLAKNNNREWFNDHKDMYLAGQANMADFAGAVLAEMNKHDNLETASGKDSLFRIYRDVRFSKEKTPTTLIGMAAFAGLLRNCVAAITFI